MFEFIGFVARPDGHFEAHRCSACGHLELCSGWPPDCPMCARLKVLEDMTAAATKVFADWAQWLADDNAGFGALPDRLNDGLAALQAALDAQEALQRPEGQEVME